MERQTQFSICYAILDRQSGAAARRCRIRTKRQAPGGTACHAGGGSQTLAGEGTLTEADLDQFAARGRSVAPALRVACRPSFARRDTIHYRTRAIMTKLDAGKTPR